MLGYRLIKGIDIVFLPSHCIHCNHPIAWYDLIPVISWLILRGRCRSCKQPISPLYPGIELLTTIALIALYNSVPITYFPAYFIFFSALIVIIRSDLETMYISQFMTLWMIPIGICASIVGALPISWAESIAGTCIGYAFLWSIARGFYYFTGKEGMGEGDFELLAMIGSFTGITGCWATIMIGSFSGSLLALSYFLITRPQDARSIRIPFGPFLAIGAIIFVLARSYIETLFFQTVHL